MKLNAFNKPKGWIEVICGPMFAGKSEELLRRINRFKYADISYIIFKPKIDTRNSNASSRDGRTIKSVSINSSTDIINYLEKYESTHKTKIDAIAIDEAQFLDEELGSICNKLANLGYVVYVSGLDLDFRGIPFPTMANVLAYADHVTKLTAICTVCGAEANRTQRLINDEPARISDPIIKIGDKESYEARCRQHHQIKK